MLNGFQYEKLESYLGNCFHELKLDSSMAAQFLSHLKTCDPKAFQKYLRVMQYL